MDTVSVLFSVYGKLHESRSPETSPVCGTSALTLHRAFVGLSMENLVLDAYADSKDSGQPAHL